MPAETAVKKMSRIGKKPINLPDKVNVQLKDSQVEVKGPAGTLHKTIPAELTVRLEGKTLTTLPRDENSAGARLMHGMFRTTLSNMVQGVVQPWKKELEIQGVGYRAAKAGQVLNLQLGYSHPIDFKMPEAVQFAVDAKQTLVTLTSADKELLGNVAAKIRSLRPPEPYKGKGIRYLGEHILRKAGKAAGAVGGGAAGAKK